METTLLFYTPHIPLSLVHHYSILHACVLTSLRSLDHPKYKPGLGFILGMVINVLRPSSNAKYHDNYSIVPNLYIRTLSALHQHNLLRRGG
jgi:hypothetical protein